MKQDDIRCFISQAFWILLMIFMCFSGVFSLALFAQNLTERGDVTGDGAIDGRDALRVLRSVAGLETLTVEETERGDVYPYPGTAGRAIGDSVLTEEDARQILRYAVRSIPKGDLTGEFANSPPVIKQFEPRSGAVGDLITISGENFVDIAPENNIVRIGGVPVPISEITGTSIVVTISSDARSGVIEVLTPGGFARSEAQFTVTAPIQGRMELGSGLNPQDFTIVGALDETNDINPQGNFSVDVKRDGVSLIGAASNQDANNNFLALAIPGFAESGSGKASRIMQAETSLTINAMSTAKVLLYLYPFFATDNIPAVQRLMQIMDTVPEVAALADVIGNRYPKGANGLDDPAVLEAWSNAVRAVMDHLPSGLVFSVNASPGAGAATQVYPGLLAKPTALLHPPQRTPYLKMLPQGSSGIKPVSLRPAGADYVVLEYDSHSGAIKAGYPETNNYSPLDWVVTFYRVDPGSVRVGLENPFFAAKQAFSRLGQGEFSILPASQWTQNIDVVGTAINFTFDGIAGWFDVGSDGFSLDRDTDGIYVCRIYSGSIGNNDPEDLQIIDRIPDGRENANRAIVTNIGIAVLDLWGLVAGSEEGFLKNALKLGAMKGAAVLLEDGRRLYPMRDVNESLRILVRVVTEVAKGVADAAKDSSLSAAQKKLSNTLASAIRSSSAITATLAKISSAGRIGERIAGMMGYLLNPLDFELSPAGPTPLETYFIQVGDPFTPSISRTEPGKGGPESRVTLFGDHFQLKPENNIVTFGDYPAKVLQVVDQEQMIVQVPQFAPPFENLRITLKTSASPITARAPQTFLVDPLPAIYGITPPSGYSPTNDENNPFHGQRATVVEITGVNLDVRTGPWSLGVKFNGKEANVLSRSSKSIVASVPPGLNGVVQIIVTDFNRDIDSNSLPFHVYGPPRIDGVSPNEVQGGETFVIHGSYLFDAKVQVKDTFLPVIRTSRREIIAEMSDVGEEGESLPLTVWTPAGSTQSSIVRKAGLKRPQAVDPLPSSHITVHVNDPRNVYSKNGKLSMSEAIDIANGKLNPFIDGWDDQNIIVDKVYQAHAITDENGNFVEYEYLFIRETTHTTPGGYGAEFRFVREIYVNDEGEQIRVRVIETTSLDAGQSDKEEGDYLECPSPPDLCLFAQDLSEFNLKPYKDLIVVDDTANRVSSGSVVLGPQDEIQLREDVVWNLDGTLSALNHNRLTSGTVTGRGEIALAGQSTIVSATIDGPRVFMDSPIGVRLGDIRILNTVGNGLEIQGGGLNQIYAVIEQCSGDGIHLSGSDHNDLGIVALDCGGNGVTIKNSPFTSLRVRAQRCAQGVAILDSKNCTLLGDPGVQNCDGAGIIIQNEGFDIIDGLFIQGNQGHGIDVQDAEGITLSNLTVSGNDGDGIRLDGSAGQHGLKDLIILGNKGNGLVVRGSNNANNTFSYIVLGGNRYNTVAGNGENGLLLEGGAHDNRFEYCSMYGNKQNGVLVRGSGTDNNEFIQCDVAYETARQDAEYGNWGDGIQITDGASENALIQTNFGQNHRNGVNISGGNSNRVDQCFIGDVLAFRNMGYNRPNKGWGVRVAEDALGAIIRSCTFTYNLQGDIYLENLNHPNASLDNPAVRMESCKFGTYKEWTEVRSKDNFATGGAAIGSNNAKYVRGEDLLIYGHDNGVALAGERNEGIRLNNLIILYPRQRGMSLENTKDLAVGPLRLSRSRGDGIYLNNVENAEFYSTPFVNGLTNHFCFGSSGGGLIVRGSKHILFQDAYIGESGAKGVELAGTSDFRMQDCWIDQSGGDGMTVTNCSGITLLTTRIERSAEMGLQITNCNGLELIGRSLQNGFSVSGGSGAALWIENSQNIAIGKGGRGGGIGPGVVITGESSENIQVESSMLSGVPGTEAVRIDGGRGIVIGSPVEPHGNEIGIGAKTGVLVQGENTQVSILNNIIGESEQYESGARAYGSEVGVILEKGVSDTLIQGNIINANYSHGILLRDGAHSNMIRRNQITENGGNGVQVEGPTTLSNQITQNSISRNLGRGIRLLNGGNANIESPIITKAERQQEQVFGEVPSDAPDGSQVEVYWDNDDEGEHLVGIGYLFGKKFLVTGSFPPVSNLHAIIIHPGGNTSEFGPSIITAKPDPFIYTEYKGDGSDILLFSPVAHRSTRITHSPDHDFHPALSADAQKMLFVTEREGNPDIWLMPLNTFDPVPVVSNPAADYDPDWNADNSGLVFVSERDGNPEIYLKRFASPGSEGAEIYYFSGDINESALDIFRSGMAGDAMGVKMTSDAGRVSKIAVYIDADPAPFTWKILPMGNWSPDATTSLAEGEGNPTETGWHVIDLENLQVPEEYAVMIYFKEDYKPKIGLAQQGDFSWVYSGFSGLWRMDRDRPAMIKVIIDPQEENLLQRLTENDAVDSDPTVSPDGTQIAFSSNRAGHADIWLMTIDGSNLRNVTQSMGDDRKPAWSPDGEQIAFTSTRDGNPEIYIMDSDGGNVRRLTDHEAVDDDPVWNTDGDHILFASDRNSGFEIYSANINNPFPRRMTVGMGDLRDPETGQIDVRAIELTAPAFVEGKSSITQKPLSHESMTALSDNPLRMSLSSHEVAPGESFQTTLQLDRAQSLGNLELEIVYDPDVLRILEAPTFDFQTVHWMVEFNPRAYPSHFTPLRLNWIGAEGLNAEQATLQIAFEVLPGVSRSETSLRFQVAKAYDIDLNPIDTITTEGQIRINTGQTAIESWMLY